MKTTTPRKTKNLAPIGSQWTGVDSDGDRIKVTVEGSPIPGNDLRAVALEMLDLKKFKTFIGCNWFKRATRIG